MLYFRLILLFLIVKNFVYTKDVLPFPTPTMELNRIQGDCEEKGIQNIKEAKIKTRNCFMSQGSSNSDSSTNSVEAMMNDNECETSTKLNECWTPVISKINECFPGRGDTVGNIFKTLGETTCQNSKSRSPLQDEDLCKPIHLTDECHKTDDMKSAELCRSFRAQRRCEESALNDCKNKEQRARIEQDLKEVAKSLKCNGNSVLPVLWISVFLVFVLLFNHHKLVVV